VTILTLPVPPSEVPNELSEHVDPPEEPDRHAARGQGTTRVAQGFWVIFNKQRTQLFSGDVFAVSDQLVLSDDYAAVLHYFQYLPAS